MIKVYRIITARKLGVKENSDIYQMFYVIGKMTNLPYNFMEYLFSHFTKENKVQADEMTSSEVIETWSTGLEFEVLIDRVGSYSRPYTYSLHCTRFAESKGSPAAGRTKKT